MKKPIMSSLCKIVTTHAQRDKIKKALDRAINDNTPLYNEAVWNYFISNILANGKEKDKVVNIVCGEKVALPQSYKVFFEAEPKTSRKKEGNTKLDVALGNIRTRHNTKSGIEFLKAENDPSWVCFIEGKLLSDCSGSTLYYPLRNQMARIIENLLKFSNESTEFPDKTFFTLLTPKKFISNPYSRFYGYKYKAYRKNAQYILQDILEEDRNLERPDKKEVKMLIEQNISKLKINWVSYEEIIKAEYGFDLDIIEDNKSNKIDLRQIKNYMGLN